VVNHPETMTYAIAKAEYRGYKSLLADGRAEFRGVYYFSGNKDTRDQTHLIPGGEGNWQIAVEVPPADLVYLPCGQQRQLNMVTRLVAFQGAGNEDKSNYISMESTDSTVAEEPVESAETAGAEETAESTVAEKSGDSTETAATTEAPEQEFSAHTTSTGFSAEVSLFL
jgi:hypothetical protein